MQTVIMATQVRTCATFFYSLWQYSITAYWHNQDLTTQKGVLVSWHSTRLDTQMMMMMCNDEYGPKFSAECGILSRTAEFARFRRISRFCGILYWPVIQGTNTAYFVGVQAAVLYVYIISQWNTWQPLGLWREEYWKYWAAFIWNIAI